MFLSKLGLVQDHGDTDTALIQDLLACFHHTETDMTIFFRALAKLVPEKPQTWVETLADSFYDLADFKLNHVSQMQRWLEQYTARIQQEGEPLNVRAAKMNAVNPKYVMRNYLAQLAIDDAEEGDPTKIKTLIINDPLIKCMLIYVER